MVARNQVRAGHGRGNGPGLMVIVRPRVGGICWAAGVAGVVAVRDAAPRVRSLPGVGQGRQAGRVQTARRSDHRCGPRRGAAVAGRGRAGLPPAGLRRAAAGLVPGLAPARPRPGRNRGEVTPDRARCRACRVSHVLLPAGWLPRRGYDVEIVGAALLAAAEGAGYRRAATRVDVPASTVRDWIHAARDGAAGLSSDVSGVIEAAGARLHPPQAPPVWAGRPLSEAVAALGVAARGFVLDLATPRPPGPGGRPSGIDYLGILAERHRQHIHHQLRGVDPTGALAGLRGWPLINVLRRGRLLTCGPAG